MKESIMGKKNDIDTDLIREVGEKVSLQLSFDPEKTKDLGEGVVECIVTTSSLDRYAENIVTTGISTDNYMNNPVVLYGHDYEGLPIGKTIKLTSMKNKMKAQFQLAVEEYPFAATVYAMIKSGYLNAVSIGGRVTEWSDDYRSILGMEMVEFSVVAVPANPEALITGRAFEKAVGKSMETVREEFQDFSKKIMLDKLSGLSDDEIIDTVKVLKTLIVRLEETTEVKLSDATPTTRRIVLKDAQQVVAQSHRLVRKIKLAN
jgi:HK97 family phage prohead protease